MTGESEPRGWLVVSVPTAGAAGTLRVREPRSLLALHRQQSVGLLLARPEVMRDLGLTDLCDRTR